MRILALETSTSASSVAVLDEGRLIVQKVDSLGHELARQLVPMIKDVLNGSGLRAKDFELVAVSKGPGSFTGLRLGVTTAKTFAYAANTRVIGVNTLEVIASRAPTTHGVVECIMDAGRRQLYSASYHQAGDAPSREIRATRVVSVDQWLSTIDLSIVSISGPAVDVVRNRLPATTSIVDQGYWHPDAAAVGRLAHQYLSAGREDDPWKLMPEYYRKSAAEEKRRDV